MSVAVSLYTAHKKPAGLAALKKIRDLVQKSLKYRKCAGEPGTIPVSGRSLGEGHGNPLQCSCLENPMDRAACWPKVHGITEESDRTER